MLTSTTLSYIDPATGSIIIGAVAAGGAGVAAAASQGKARLRSIFKRGEDTGSQSDDDLTVSAGMVEDDVVEDDVDRESAESR